MDEITDITMVTVVVLKTTLVTDETVYFGTGTILHCFNKFFFFVSTIWF